MTFTGPLSEEDAVTIALWNSSALQSTLRELGLAQADLLDASLFRNPSFQVLFPVAAKPFEFVLLWPIETFWQRPRRRLRCCRSLSPAANRTRKSSTRWPS